MQLPEIDKRNMPKFDPIKHQKFLEEMSKLAGLPEGQLIQLEKVKKD